MAKKSNGEGSVYFNEKRKKWTGAVTVGTNEKGKPRRKVFYGETKREVREKMTALQAELLTGTDYIKATADSVTSLLKVKIDNEYKMNLLIPVSYLRKTETLKLLQKDSVLTSKSIGKLTKNDIIVFLSSLTSDYSNSTIKKCYALLNVAYKDAIYNDLVRKNILDGIRCPRSVKPDKKISALTVSEQKKLSVVLSAEEKDSRYKHQILLMLSTGMRMGEINALSVEDVSFAFNTINVRRTVTKDSQDRPVLGTGTKTYAGQRLIQMNTEACRILKDYIDNFYTPCPENAEHIIFYDNKSKKLCTTCQVNLCFKRIINDCSVLDSAKPYNLHMLRHTFATRCIESGMSAKVLQHILGHADIQTTLNTYCDVFDSYESDSVIAAEKYMRSIGVLSELSS